MKKFFYLLLIVIVALSACSKEKSSTPPAPEKSALKVKPSVHGDIQISAPDKVKVVVPPDVKKKWKWVRLSVEDKKKNTTSELTVAIGGKTAIPGTNIEIEAKEFLPDLRIEGNLYTTASSELLNPAVHVIIREDGRGIFNGWLFQKFPGVHPFRHPRYRIIFKEPVGIS